MAKHGTWTKDKQTREASTAAQAVRLQYDGWTRVEGTAETVEDLAKRPKGDLVEIAEALGVAIGGTRADIAERIFAAREAAASDDDGEQATDPSVEQTDSKNGTPTDVDGTSTS